MKTTHKIYNQSSYLMEQVANSSVDLIVTSPPYPMIEMWDNCFRQSDTIRNYIHSEKNGDKAFDLMHEELFSVWSECFRTLKCGGFACINIGDATRTIGNNFKLYSNHSRVVNDFCKLGFQQLPDIIWRKPTNAPNKFMGSGMLPSGAYVTYEHEYILIFRKGPKRNFTKAEGITRSKSSFFWEERNIWFSDLWSNINGISQYDRNTTSRERTAAFPIEIPYRLINMYSMYGDVVLDPFVGTGTTSVVAAALGRSSTGFDVDNEYCDVSRNRIMCSAEINNFLIKRRIQEHKNFVEKRAQENKEIKYINDRLGFPVMTRQEKNMKLYSIDSLGVDGQEIAIEYKEL